MPEADVWQLLLGAALAMAGGMVAELWREGRANRGEVRALLGEIEGLLALCERMRTAERTVSLVHFLTELHSYARAGAGASRVWLRAVTDAEDRKAILEVFSQASSLAGSLEALVASEQDAFKASDLPRWKALIESHRDLGETGILLVEHRARALLPRLQALESQPLLL